MSRHSSLDIPTTDELFRCVLPEQCVQALILSESILKVLPDTAAVWTFRRNAIICRLIDALDFNYNVLIGTSSEESENVVSLRSCSDDVAIFGLDVELILTSTKPLKAYTLWYHLLWCLFGSVTSCFGTVKDWNNIVPSCWTTLKGTELVESIRSNITIPNVQGTTQAIKSLEDFEKLCAREFRKDKRNFHAWAFLHLVHTLMAGIIQAENSAITEKSTFIALQTEAGEAELQKSDFSNYSAMHVLGRQDLEVADHAWLVPVRSSSFITVEQDISNLQILCSRFPSEAVWRYAENLLFSQLSHPANDIEILVSNARTFLARSKSGKRFELRRLSSSPWKAEPNYTGKHCQSDGEKTRLSEALHAFAENWILTFPEDVENDSISFDFRHIGNTRDDCWFLVQAELTSNGVVITNEPRPREAAPGYIANIDGFLDSMFADETMSWDCMKFRFRLKTARLAIQGNADAITTSRLNASLDELEKIIMDYEEVPAAWKEYVVKERALGIWHNQF